MVSRFAFLLDNSAQEQLNGDRGSVRKMRFRRVSEHKMFPHFLTMLQWALLLVLMAFDLDFPITATGATVQGGFKIIVFSHVLISVFSIIILVSFSVKGNKGMTEKCILVLSALTSAVSLTNILLHLVNGLVILMIVAQIITWSLFSVTFSVSVYKVLVETLTPVPKRFDALEQKAGSVNKKP